MMERLYYKVEKYLIQEVDRILEGSHQYCIADLPVYELGDVIYVGEPGITASVGRWMITVEESIERQERKPDKGFIYEKRFGEDAHEYFFSLCFGEKEIACGGTSNSGGEGTKGFDIAAYYQESFNVPVEEAKGSDLLEKMRPYMDQVSELEKTNFVLSLSDEG